MKKIIYIALVVSLLLDLVSCYDDTGNYDYHALPGIKIEGDKQLYAKQFDTLKVSVDIDLAGQSENDYDFSWRIWSNTILGTSNQKIISKEKNLNYVMGEQPGSYTLTFTCQNIKTGVKIYKQIELMVHGAITEGWMVLHEKGGVTDFSIIMSPFFSERVDKDQVISDMYKTANNEDLQGHGVKIGSYFAIGRYQHITILTDQGGVRLNHETMQRTYDINTLMLDKKPLKPENYYFFSYYWCLGKGNEVIISDGRFYENAILGSGFTEPVNRLGESYKASPYGGKWIWTFAGIIYDELKGRFLAVDKNQNLGPLPTAEGRQFDWNNLHGTLKYMDTGFGNYEYALIEDWNTHKLTLYVMNFDITNNFDVAKYDASQCPEMDKAKYYAIGNRGNVFYYANNRDIYLYDYAGPNTGRKVYSLANTSEIITGVKLLKPCIDRYIKKHPYDNKVLVISTFNASTREGKIYMYYVNESNGSIDMSSEKIFTGFGEILDMDYNYPKYGS